MIDVSRRTRVAVVVATVLGASLVVGTSAFNVDARPDISLQQATGSVADGVGGTESAAPTAYRRTLLTRGRARVKAGRGQ